MGFASGLRAGTTSAGSWIDNYKQNKEEEITNQLFKAGSEIDSQRQQQLAEGAEIDGVMGELSSMSANDIGGALIGQLEQAGGKIDDQTYKLAFGVGQLMESAGQKARLFQEKEDLLQAKESNYDNMIFNRDKGNTVRAQKDSKPYTVDADGNIDPATVDTTSKWFKTLPKDQKRTIFNAQGIKSTPTASYIPTKSNKVVTKNKSGSPVRGQVDGKKIYDGKKWIPYNKK